MIPNFTTSGEFLDCINTTAIDPLADIRNRVLEHFNYFATDNEIEQAVSSFVTFMQLKESIASQYAWKFSDDGLALPESIRAMVIKANDYVVYSCAYGLPFDLLVTPNVQLNHANSCLPLKQFYKTIFRNDESQHWLLQTIAKAPHLLALKHQARETCDTCLEAFQLLSRVGMKFSIHDGTVRAQYPDDFTCTWALLVGDRISMLFSQCPGGSYSLEGSKSGRISMMLMRRSLEYFLYKLSCGLAWHSKPRLV